MTDYTKLVKALREAKKHMWAQPQIELYPIMDDAADAIEELQQIAAHYEQSAKDYWKEACEYKAQLPKRGEWIKHPEVKNIYGGVYIECPFCGEKYVVQNVSDEKFCRNCGADLRAKMTEVQG